MFKPENKQKHLSSWEHVAKGSITWNDLYDTICMTLVGL